MRKKVAKVIRLTENESNACHLHLYENHFSFISKFNTFAKRYQCTDCNRFITMPNFDRHKKLFCQQGEIKEAFVGGKYVITKTVFEELEELEIKVPEQDRYDPYFSTFDFEAFTIPAERE